MVIGMNTRLLPDDFSSSDGLGHPYIGFASDVLPHVQAPSAASDTQMGVSTEYASFPSPLEPSAANSRWFVLRTIYGREQKASELLKAQNIKVFHPTRITYKLVNGKRKAVTISCIPNIFFAYDTFERLKSFVYDNVNFPYLRFCYNHFGRDKGRVREPLVVPTKQMEDFIQICSFQDKDIILTTDEIHQFQCGQMVRVVRGEFAGIEGRIARYKHQQRVAVVLQGFVTAITAYIPTAYIEPIPTRR